MLMVVGRVFLALVMGTVGLLGAPLVPSDARTGPILRASPPIAAAQERAELSVVELNLTGVASNALADLPEVAPLPDEQAPAGALSALVGTPEAARVSFQAAADVAAPDILTTELSTAPFSVLGVTWDATPGLADVVIRYRVRASGTWTGWDAVGPSDLIPDGNGKEAADPATRGATDALVALNADGLQVWADAGSGTVTGLKAALINPGVASEKSTTRTSTAPTPVDDSQLSVSQAAFVATAAPPAPAIISRANWGADESLKTCSPDLSTEMVSAAVHHTASTNAYSMDEVPGLIRGFYAYHTRPEAAGGRGWCDIGYNFLVDRFGRVFEGRAGGVDVPVVGVHTGGFNSRTIGIAAIGNFDTAAASAEMTEAISRTIAWKFAMHRILAGTTVRMVSGGGASKFSAGTVVEFQTIYGHRDAQFTSCPGQLLYNLLGPIRSRVAQLSNAAVAGTPFGSWDEFSSTKDAISVRGWIIDPNTTASLTLKVSIDGVVHQSLADRDRPDVAMAFPGFGGRHGYSVTIPATSGVHAVCIRAVNSGEGAERILGCRWITVTNALPIGQFETVSIATNSVTVKGWALDPDSSDPITVHVYVDSGAKAALANLDRPDLAPHFPSTSHGYSVTVPAPAGTHRVCVYAINVPAGNNPALGCRTVTVTNPLPVGQLDTLTTTATTVTVRGWAVDPDAAGPIAVHVYVDTRGSSATANVNRPDLAGLFPSPAHGYAVTVPATPGIHKICVYAINVPAGNNPALGCRTVTLTNQVPVGQLDTLTTTANSVTVRGWAVDPDTNDPIAVHVYVDGGAKASVANLDRPDLAPHFPSSLHGYNVTVPATPGAHRVCVYGINTPAGNNPALGCRTINL